MLIADGTTVSFGRDKVKCTHSRQTPTCLHYNWLDFYWCDAMTTATGQYGLRTVWICCKIFSLIVSNGIMWEPHGKTSWNRPKSRLSTSIGCMKIMCDHKQRYDATITFWSPHMNCANEKATDDKYALACYLNWFETAVACYVGIGSHRVKAILCTFSLKYLAFVWPQPAIAHKFDVRVQCNLLLLNKC